ncbi:MAG: hypothetical protein OEM85_18100 [Gammaproteobacteria bacterium]|nr:hypothetical protein [Gammaproteobacteria bacterium]MDH3375275.1 hypothetical protein [Gammaproteobacteria bacterium]
MYFQQSGGAIGHVAADATPFAHRKSQASMIVLVAWPLENDAAPHVE